MFLIIIFIFIIFLAIVWYFSREMFTIKSGIMTYKITGPATYEASILESPNIKIKSYEPHKKISTNKNNKLEELHKQLRFLP